MAGSRYRRGPPAGLKRRDAGRRPSPAADCRFIQGSAPTVPLTTDDLSGTDMRDIGASAFLDDSGGLLHLSFTSNDDGDVMVFIRYAFTVTATGKDVAMNLHHYWRFREGKVA